MEEIKFALHDKAAFYIEEYGERIAEMIVGIDEGKMSVYHTEVKENFEGLGIGTRLIEAMSEHAQKENLKVIPICPFVKAHFNKQK